MGMGTIDTLDVKIGGDAADLEKAMQKAQKAIADFAESTKTLGKNLSLYVTAPLSILGGVAVKAFSEQENAMRQLEAALKANGQNVEQNMAKYTAFATQIQRITTTADETVLKLIQMSQSMGVTGDNAIRAAKNAIALGSAFGISAEGTIRMTSALEQGNVKMLKRYIPALRGIKDDTIAVAEAQRILGGMFGVAVAQAGTFTGQLAQLKNNFGEFLELIGGDIAELLTPFITEINTLVNSLQNMDAETRKSFVQFAVAAAVLGPALIALGGMTLAINSIINAVGGLSLASQLARGGLLALAMSPLGILALAIAAAASAMGAFDIEIKSVSQAYHDFMGGVQLVMEDARHIFANTAIFFETVFLTKIASVKSAFGGLLSTIGSIMSSLPGLGSVADSLTAQGEAYKSAALAQKDLSTSLADEQSKHLANREAIINKTESLKLADETTKKATESNKSANFELQNLKTSYEAAGGGADTYKKSVDSLLSSVGGIKSELRQELEAMDKLEEALIKMPTRHDEIVQAMEIQKKKIKELQIANSLGFQKMSESTDSWASTFTSALKNGENAFEAFATSILNRLADMAFKAAESGLNEALGGIFSGGGGGGFLSGIFGGSGSGSSSNSAGEDSSSGFKLSDIFGGAFAKGGVAPASKMSIVGENGPEILIPSSPTRVVPFDQMQVNRGGAMGVGSSGGIMQTININSVVDARGADAGVDRRIREILYSEEPRIVKRAVTEAMSSVRNEVNRGGQFAKDMGRRR
jgi:hypothetical protein